jgi:hypothetical protein
MLRRRLDPVSEFDAPIPNDFDGRVEADAIRITGTWSPGLCEISKAGVIFTWDKRKGYGLGGAWLIFTGDDLSEFDITWRFWRQDQIDAWKAFQKTNFSKPPVQPQQNGAFLPNIPKPKALGVYNPILNELGITQMVPKTIGQFRQTVIGKWEKTISFYQFKPPVPLIGRPNQAVPDTKPKAPTADDAVQLEIRAKRLDVERRQKYLAQGQS